MNLFTKVETKFLTKQIEYKLFGITIFTRVVAGDRPREYFISLRVW